ncbi:TonB family protein [Sphingomonas sp. 28-63-12]|uniref:TonB family protein n=1 Tax=Sphingomonas sp. 28-63-12 TaxID=1970434 RepID=UPI000BCE6FE6|nr:MAG: hypothetical protein B7Y47_07755 [Sphingomonas sp. 28-63-12]
MTTRTSHIDSDRIAAAVAAVLVELVVGGALIFGFAVQFAAPVADPLKLFAVAPIRPPPEPTIAVEREAAPHHAGAASPPNRKAQATDIVAPVPVIANPTPPPVIVALKADVGAVSNSGAAPIVGPGTGNGGQGDGSGSGGSGDGEGGGSPLRQIGGRITGNDYPRGPYEAGIGGTLYVRYIVGIKGRVTDCAVVRTSGNAELDATTCRLITQRFRYRPRRDAAGKPIPAVIAEDHTWVVDKPAMSNTDDAP